VNFSLKLKKEVVYFKISVFLLFFLTLRLAQAQEINPDSTAVPSQPDSLIILQDDEIEYETLQEDTTMILKDTLNITDTTRLAAQQPQSDIETTIQYDSKDSMRFDYIRSKIKLYGEAVVTYGDISLKAAEIELDWNTNTVVANGVPDSTGQLTGTPIFQDGDEIYETKEIKYNFNTEKAIISGVVTEQGEAILHAGTIKKAQNDVIYGSDMIYTTCNLPDPHFSIRASKFKKLPAGNTLVGPFHMRIADIPTPLGFLFGIFPNKREKTSGIIVPTYGEERRRGFFLRDGGYFFAISDYITMTLLGEIYSKGSVGTNISADYRKRYRYSGGFNLAYNRQKAIAEGDSSITEDFWIRWNHTPVSRGNSRFAASVNAGSGSYNQNNPTLDLNRNLRQEFSSNVTYTKIFKGTPFSLTTTTRLQQNVQSGAVTAVLPDVSLSINRIYPFKNLGKPGSWYSRLFVGGQDLRYSRKVSNRVTVETESGQDSTYLIPFTLNNFNQIWRNADTQSDAQPMRFDIPIQTDVTIFKYFTFTPSLSYTENWFFKKLAYTYDAETDRFDEELVGGFGRAFSVRGSAGLSTNIYGFMRLPFKGVERVRHMITPQVNFAYSPDLSQQVFGFYDTVTNAEGTVDRWLPKFRGAPGRGESGSLNFSVRNNLEMKVKEKSDTAETTKKIPLIENFSISSGYNFLADSFQLNNISASLRTRLFKNKLDLNLRATIDPYVYFLEGYNRSGRPIQRRVNKLAWEAGSGLGQITNANLSIGMSLNPEARKKENEVRDQLDRENLSEDEMAQLDYIRDNPDLYVDFTIPWNLRFTFTTDYRKRGFEEATIRQALSFNGDVSLTEQWKITFNSGYDFEKNDFTMTSLGISRDLHCWQMDFNWVPFGSFTSYNITINAKSSLLQDLKLNKQKSWRDR